jgi:hypothetical protein
MPYLPENQLIIHPPARSQNLSRTTDKDHAHSFSRGYLTWEI